LGGTNEKQQQYVFFFDKKTKFNFDVVQIWNKNDFYGGWGAFLKKKNERHNLTGFLC